MRGVSKRGNREVARLPVWLWGWDGPLGEGKGRKPEMNDRGKSDSRVVPAKLANKTGQPVAELGNASTPTWCGGSARSTSGCGQRRRPSGVGGGSSSEPRACSRTGNGFLPSRLSGDQDDKSPVTGDCYAGICGSPGLKCPGPPDRSTLLMLLFLALLRDPRADGATRI